MSEPAKREREGERKGRRKIINNDIFPSLWELAIQISIYMKTCCTVPMDR